MAALANFQLCHAGASLAYCLITLFTLVILAKACLCRSGFAQAGGDPGLLYALLDSRLRGNGSFVAKKRY
ncbi:MAG: hypothetical protein NTZ78_03080 [Candidatus Aureabacteria bacterium]|nr:hypothetical protein [Candidatus Auribacterota bacterium]